MSAASIECVGPSLSLSSPGGSSSCGSLEAASRDFPREKPIGSRSTICGGSLLPRVLFFPPPFLGASICLWIRLSPSHPAGATMERDALRCVRKGVGTKSCAGSAYSGPSPSHGSRFPAQISIDTRSGLGAGHMRPLHRPPTEKHGSTLALKHFDLPRNQKRAPGRCPGASADSLHCARRLRSDLAAAPRQPPINIIALRLLVVPRLPPSAPGA